jgi:NAD(P)-dependent dehydrogenase (short-subunit alcohol dehydrogenase family)
LNVLSPGPVDTPIVNKVGISDEAKEEFTNKSLLKRWGKFDEVAKLARFLLSDDSSFVVGTEMLIDGGVRWG